MRLLDRYLLRETLLTSLIALSSLVGILLTIRMLKFASLVVNKGVALSQIGGVFISIVPTFLELAIPMSVLLGALIGTSRLSGDSELIIARASGISLGRLARPILWLGMGATLCALVVGIVAKPWGSKNLSNTLFEIARSRSTAGLEAGIFNELGPITLYAESIKFDVGTLHRVLIDDRREGSRKIIVARLGQMSSSQARRTITLHLTDGSIHEILPDTKAYVLTKFDTNQIIMNADELFNDGENRQELAPRELYNEEIVTEVAEVVANPEFNVRNDKRRRVNRLRQELASRFASPFSAIVLALLGYCLGIIPPRTQRTWGIGASVALSLGVFVVYYGLLSLSVSLISGSYLASFIAAWIPNILLGLAAWCLLRNLASERWSSILDGLTAIRHLITNIRFRRQPV